MLMGLDKDLPGIRDNKMEQLARSVHTLCTADYIATGGQRVDRCFMCPVQE
jgi:hypothetical protein